MSQSHDHDRPHIDNSRADDNAAGSQQINDTVQSAPSTNLMVWAGVALGVAGLTAAGVMLGRRLASPAAKPHHRRVRQRSENVVQEITRNANQLSHSLNGVVQSVNDALQTFRNASGQAPDIVKNFSAIADLFRGAMRTNSAEFKDHSTQAGDAQDHLKQDK